MRLIIHCFLFLFLSLALTGCPRSEAGTSKTVHVQITGNALADAPADAPGVAFKNNDIELTAPANFDIVVSVADAKQPLPPKSPATSKADEHGAEADSGEAGKTPSNWGLNGTLIIGLGLIIAGGLIFFAKRAGIAATILPGPTAIIARIAVALPKGSGIGLMALGGGLIVLPWLLDSVQPLVLPAAGIACAVLVVWWIYNIVQAERQQKREAAL